MTYTTASGVQIPQGTDAFNPTAQFRDWADGDDVFNNFLNVNLDSERTALTAPKLRDGVFCWVRATGQLWSYQGTTWVREFIPFAMATGVVQSANVAGSNTAPLYWDGGTAITFPTGRFTVAPIVHVTLQDDPSGGVAWVTAYSTTTTGTAARVLRAGGAPTASYKIGWTAIQMTPTTAAG